MQTAWIVNWAQKNGNGLYITGAWFKKGPKAPWMSVLYDARISELFVPYHPGSPRFYDVSYGFSLIKASAQDAGPTGSVLGNPAVVVKEIRDRGILWKDYGAVRRGQELVLWGALGAANYNYLIQYGFQDDGTITFRLGSTAHNYPGMEMVAHMHNACWRVDIDLDGAANNSVYTMEHHEPAPGTPIDPLKASDSHTPFNNGVEGGIDWDAKKFTMIHVINTKTKNAHGQNIAYDLMPMRMGSARHKEPFTQHDFWVTPYRANELSYTQLPTYVAQKRPIMNTDVVLWYMSSMHHEPRNEDGEYVSNQWKGVALTMWSGFDLRPRNLFDRTPLYP
jgi:primary-amine oxidase